MHKLNKLRSSQGKEIKHMARSKPNTNKDHKIFSNTAAKGKKINIKPVISRGGIRL